MSTSSAAGSGGRDRGRGGAGGARPAGGAGPGPGGAGGSVLSGGGEQGGAGPVCANGVREGDEECDDGNTIEGDGCDKCVVVCPTNWDKLPNLHCYEVFGNNMDWTESVNFCSGFGAGFHLVTLVDAAELAAVGMLTATNEDYWVGGNDMATEGTFVWVTGEVWGWQNGVAPWAGNNPSNSGGNEHCVELFGDNGLINDDGCSKNHHQICEFTPPG